jgi:hypothetical protein
VHAAGDRGGPIEFEAVPRHPRGFDSARRNEAQWTADADDAFALPEPRAW